MKVVIVGCGKVGFTLAEALSSEKHDVTVIDQNADKVERLSNHLDVVGVAGNGASYRVLQEAGVDNCDVLIAATSQDEVNMLCCLIGRKAAQCRTIARVRDPNYYSEIGFIQEELGLSLAINPELSAANACFQLVRTPFASELDSFASGKVEMVTFQLPENSRWIGKKLMDITRESKYSFLLAIITRDHKALIPNGNTVVKRGDRLSIILDSNYIKETMEYVGVEYHPIKHVFIAGGGTVGYYLAKRLLEAKIKVTIFEPQRPRAIELNDLLPQATIIYGDPCNESVLLEEGIEDADAFCALNRNDSENIMMSFFVGQVSKAKRITRINKVSMGGMLEDLPLGALVCPKSLTAEYILRYVRAMSGGDNTSSMEAVYRMAGGQVEALAFRVKGESEVTGRKLMNLSIRTGVLLCAIIRHGKVIMPTGQDVIHQGDQVVLVTTQTGIYDLTDILK